MDRTKNVGSELDKSKTGMVRSIAVQLNVENENPTRPSDCNGIDEPMNRKSNTDMTSPSHTELWAGKVDSKLVKS